ncbi:MAG: threonylcarbamoyl-AMP synthase [Aquificae bacterium]|nr:threonylcarbamoyl-AMP synthase [Aquificota bacterium]
MKNTLISKDWNKAKEYLKNNKIIIAPTDTLYGILGNALNKTVVEYIYQIKKRKPEKPYIILIPDTEFLSIFGISPSKEEKKVLEKTGITVVIDLPSKYKEKFHYLHRGQKSLAFRIPAKRKLLNLLKDLKKPLVAPSANPEGEPPAKNIQEAINYFGNKVDLYIDEGEIKNKNPSTIIKFVEGKPIVLRKGNISISHINHILQIK